MTILMGEQKVDIVLLKQKRGIGIGSVNTTNRNIAKAVVI